MALEQVGIANNHNYVSLLRNFIIRILKKSRSHDYSDSELGTDYAFEQVEGGTRGYMTGQGRGVRQGDCIVLRVGSCIEQYRVEKIDYYSSPSNMWIALLSKKQHPEV